MLRESILAAVMLAGGSPRLSPKPQATSHSGETLEGIRVVICASDSRRSSSRPAAAKAERGKISRPAPPTQADRAPTVRRSDTQHVRPGSLHITLAPPHFFGSSRDTPGVHQCGFPTSHRVGYSPLSGRPGSQFPRVTQPCRHCCAVATKAARETRLRARPASIKAEFGHLMSFAKRAATGHWQ